MLSLITTYGHENYIDHSIALPSQYLLDSTRINHVFISWNRLNDIVKCLFYSYFSPIMCSHLIGTRSITDMWHKLQAIFFYFIRSSSNGFMSPTSNL